MSDLVQDLRYACRQFTRTPAFSLFVIATLAIGIGANATVFSAVNALLFQPLPWDDSHRLVQLSGSYTGRGDTWSVSLPNAQDWGERSRSFEEVALLQGASASMAGESPERLSGISSSANLFTLLRAQPALGRVFTAAEAQPDADRVVVLGHGLWQRQFGGDEGVIGSNVSLNGRPHSIIGVMPPGFSYPDATSEFYIPLRANSTTWNRASGGLQVLARLAPGVDIDQARAEMSGISAQLAQEYPAENQELSAHIRPLREALFGRELPRVLYLLLGAVGFVLLIACVNVANMLLARAVAREREIAVRSAIGAGRARVLRQLLTESMVLALAGAAAGLLLALWGTRALQAVMPRQVSIASTFGVDSRVLLFTLAITIVTGALFGMAPALHAARTELMTLLGGRGAANARQRARRRNTLVVAEVALASVLLVSAGLMLRSLGVLLSTNAGFDPDNVLTMRVALDARYDSSDKVAQFQRELLERLRGNPAVHAAGAVDWIPMAGTSNFNDIIIDGDQRHNVGTLIATPGYVEAMQIPLLRGRTISDADASTAPGVAVVSRSMAERLWPGEDALGKRLRTTWEGGGQPYWRTVVGVVADVRHGGMNSDPRAEMYLPFSQMEWAVSSMGITVRTRTEPLALVSAVREAVRSTDPNLALYDIRTMDRVVRESGAVAVARVMAIMLAIFGAVSLLLAALGLYGVISYNVLQRTQEIGVRAALGADRASLLALVMRQGMLLVVLGLAAGLVAAIAVARALDSLLYGLSPTDPLAYAGVVVLLLGVSAAATFVPARRAARVDPLVAMRAE